MDYGVSFILFMYKNVYMSFKSVFGSFKGVAVDLSCIWLFLVLFGFFKGWPGLICWWPPGNPDCHMCLRAFWTRKVQNRILTIVGASFAR